MQTCVVRRADRCNITHYRRWRGRNAVHQSCDERNRHRRQNVHYGTGESDHDSLITRTEIEHLPGWDVSRALSLQGRIRFISSELDVTTEGNCRDSVISVSQLLAE